MAIVNLLLFNLAYILIFMFRFTAYLPITALLFQLPIIYYT